MSTLKRALEPDESQNAQIVAFPVNLSVAVTGNGVVHRRITAALEELRKDENG
jgi:hypothetical protein